MLLFFSPTETYNTVVENNKLSSYHSVMIDLNQPQHNKPKCQKTSNVLGRKMSSSFHSNNDSSLVGIWYRNLGLIDKWDPNSPIFISWYPGHSKKKNNNKQWKTACTYKSIVIIILCYFTVHNIFNVQ